MARVGSRSPKSRPQPNPCGPDCPVHKAAKVLDGKWTILLFRDLLGGARSYSELKRSLTGITPRMLALRLRSLEKQGLLHRQVFSTVPPQTEYSLTPRGLQLRGVIEALANYGQTL